MNTDVRNYGVKELIQLLWANWLTIILVTALFAVGSVFYALWLPNLYQAEAKLEYVREEDGGISGAAGQIGQLASLAGFNLGSMQGKSKESVDLVAIRSQKFLGKFIEQNDVLVPLFATESWDLSSRELVINPEVYDESSQNWVREVAAPLTQKPSSQEAVAVFREIFNIDKDKESGVIVAQVTHQSPDLAYFWLSQLITNFNEYIRKQDLDQSLKNIEYLRQKAEEIDNSNMQTVFYSLLEEEQKRMMLANVSEEYVFRKIDPPLVPEMRYSPKRALICIGGTFFGGIVAVMFVLIRQFLREG